MLNSDDFAREFYQSSQIIFILFNLFQNIEKDRKGPNACYKDDTALNAHVGKNAAEGSLSTSMVPMCDARTLGSLSPQLGTRKSPVFPLRLDKAELSV